MSNMVAILGNGTEVMLRPITPHVSQALTRRLEETMPPKPELPVRMERTKAGTVEPLAVDKDSDEHKQWEVEYKDWLIEKRRVVEKLEFDNMVQVLDYCVIAWRQSSNVITRVIRKLIPFRWVWQPSGLWWENEPPTDWEPHPLEREGTGDWSDRMLYLLSCVLVAPGYADVDTVWGHTVAPSTPVTSEEVARQRDGF